ncbi:MAG: HAD family hydrolase [Clostridia bacterium]|nr:HAD family hydrolase [Clostridia bacterium]
MIKKLLIWDIDGTLVDCGAAGRRAMDQTFKVLFGIDHAFDGIAMSGRLDRVILREAFQKHGLPERKLSNFYEHYEQILDDILGQTEVKLYKGIVEVLNYSSAHEDMINVISTGNCEVGAWLKLKHAGIDHYFEHGGFGCGFTEREALVGYIITAMEQHYNVVFEKKDVVVIGDTPHDIVSGKHHLATTIAVLTGGYSRADLQKYEPTYIVEDFSCINDIIDMLEV